MVKDDKIGEVLSEILSSRTINAEQAGKVCEAIYSRDRDIAKLERAATRYAELERAAREYQRAGAVFASVGYGAPHYDGQLHANAHGEYLRAIEAVLLAARNLDTEQGNE